MGSSLWSGLVFCIFLLKNKQNQNHGVKNCFRMKISSNAPSTDSAETLQGWFHTEVENAHAQNGQSASNEGFMSCILCGAPNSINNHMRKLCSALADKNTDYLYIQAMEGGKNSNLGVVCLLTIWGLFSKLDARRSLFWSWLISIFSFKRLRE